MKLSKEFKWSINIVYNTAKFLYSLPTVHCFLWSIIM